MKCPACGSEVADNLEVCPACHASLAMTRVMPKLTGTWCSSCGALIPAGSEVCPKCGLPASTPSTTAAENELRQRKSEERRLEAERTNAMPRIESAIPSEPDPSSESAYGRERLPHTRVFALAAVASLLIVGGASLAITHPWDPSLNDTKATMPADTSQAGFPGTVNKLSGQDKSGTGAISVQSADEATYSALLSAYEQLGDISSRADELDSLLDSTGVSGSKSERADAQSQAEQLSLDASNLVTTIQNIDVDTTGTYSDQKTNVSTLASWLRNRVEAIAKAWKLSEESSDPSSDSSKIMAPMAGNRESDSSDAYVNLFKKNYEAWKPVER